MSPDEGFIKSDLSFFGALDNLVTQSIHLIEGISDIFVVLVVGGITSIDDTFLAGESFDVNIFGVDFSFDCRGILFKFMSEGCNIAEVGSLFIQ